ncbi:AAA family ATPase [Micromonospora matsumotoense]|uniref:AAA family ATPase n=1 Tax=Micromonospora matsumotoense TaxID=121616 RepID=UPI0034401B05
MRLHSIYARFYRSLNYDFIRASGDNYAPDPWDGTSEGDYPFVRIRLRPDITTVVGGNESGKTQVLRAIEAALTGGGYDRSDFCRYSRFFGVDKAITKPEFGALFSDVSPDDVRVVEQMSSLSGLTEVDRIAIFRVNETPQLRVYARHGGIWSGPSHVRTPKALAGLGMPRPFRIDADVPLPDSVPLDYIVGGKPVASVGRELLRRVWDTVVERRNWFDDASTVTNNASEISGLFRPLREATSDELSAYKLAADLLLDVAGLSRELFAELQTAVKTKNGYANSIVDTINAELAKALNFPHWWSQDSKFELFVSLYEYDLVFMIRDRTGRTYGFDERSDGLKYFLSYFVQYLAHQDPADGTQEILLMDEPDRYLSSSGQQDLLRIFEDFARPQDSIRAPVQVVYVTHSPFLIDKNEADRIRVLEKGEHDEGTRVVTSAAANHYEPLRSAFGSFVAETTFIGNCNIMVEGPSDQVLLAGASRWLAGRQTAARERLDLNKITIVPAGGTRHVPYLVYLARGRDVEKPPVVVLLDNDRAGDEARTALQAGGAYGSALIKSNLVLQLGKDDLAELATQNPAGIAGIEDIIPFEVAVAAAHVYCKEFVPAVDVAALHLDREQVYDADADAATSPNRGTLKYLEAAIAARTGTPSFHLDKVAFSRAVIDVLADKVPGVTAAADDIKLAHDNFRILLTALARAQRDAERAESVERISSRINRIKSDFVRTRRGSARREDVLNLIEEISSQLDNSREAEDLRRRMRRWEEDFALLIDPREPVDDFASLLKAIHSLAYHSIRTSAGVDQEP